MLLVIFVMLVVISAVCVYMTDNDWHITVWELFGFINLGAIAICCFIKCINYAYADIELAEKQVTYEALIYKMESPACRDEFGLLSKDIIDEVQEWNETLTFNKARSHNFWTGILYPNYWDELEFIDYNLYTTN